jgi:capsular polysaccharide biosynthesis protein
VTLVSRATAPVSASKPKVLTGLIMGAFATLILALGLPLLFDLFNRRVRCRDDLERDHGVPVLVEFSMLPKRRLT